MSSIYTVKTGIVSGDVILVGDFEVGKTSFFCRAQSGRFNADNNSFMGASFNSVASIYYESYRVLKNGHEIKMTLHDTADQERFHTIPGQYYRKGNVIVLIYAVSDAKSFDSLQYWAREIKKFNNDAPVFLIGNKIDEGSVISDEEVQEFRRNAEIKYWTKLSVKTGENFEEAVNLITEILHGQMTNRNRTSTLTLTEDVKLSCAPTNRKCCPYS